MYVMYHRDTNSLCVTLAISKPRFCETWPAGAGHFCCCKNNSVKLKIWQQHKYPHVLITLDENEKAYLPVATADFRCAASAWSVARTVKEYWFAVDQSRNDLSTKAQPSGIRLTENVSMVCRSMSSMLHSNLPFLSRSWSEVSRIVTVPSTSESSGILTAMEKSVPTVST